MKGYSTRLEEATRKNSYFRRVLYTGKPSQLIPMSLGPGEEIGEETHRTVDQFLRETGEGTVVIDGKSHRVKDGEGGSSRPAPGTTSSILRRIQSQGCRQSTLRPNTRIRSSGI
jgi:hypothetical protein